MQQTELEKQDFVRVLNLHHDVIPGGVVGGFNCDFGPQGSSEAHKDLPRNVAEYLTELWPNQLFISGEGKVVEYNDVQVRETEDFMYIANVTGDPDEPEFMTVDINTDKEGRKIPSKEKNMRRDPRIVRELIGGGHTHSVSPDGSYNQFTHPKRMYTIPPMQRVRLPMKVAKAILYKDLRNMPWVRGSVIESRAPQAGEPKMSWTIDELRLYGIYLLGEKRGKLAFPETGADVEARLLAEGLNKDDQEFLEKLMNVKATYHAKLMKRVLAKSVPLPTQSEFQAFVRKEEEKAKRKAEHAAKQSK